MFDGLYHPFMLILGMVYDCFNHMNTVLSGNFGYPNITCFFSSNGDDFERVARSRGLQHHPHPSWMLSIQKIGQPPPGTSLRDVQTPGGAMSVQIIQTLTDIVSRDFSGISW